MDEIKTFRLTNRRIVYLVSVFLHLLMLSTSGALYKMFEAPTLKIFFKNFTLIAVMYLVAWGFAYMIVRVLKVRVNWKS